MEFIVYPFMLLSAAGLVLSLVVHVSALLGLAISFGGMVWGLHAGVFVVFIPTLIFSTSLVKDAYPRDYWKAAMRGCPGWLKGLTYFFFGYAILNFVAFFVLSTAPPGGHENGANTLRGFSGHWMLFYCAALAINYSVLNAKREAAQRVCPNGHPVSPDAKYCEECGVAMAEKGRWRRW